MRLLTHNTMKNNSAEAKGKGFPLRITATEIRVADSGGNNNRTKEEEERQLSFVKGLFSSNSLDWSALVQSAKEMGIPTLPPILSKELVDDREFLMAVYHVLMNVHLVKGVLTCPVTGREFAVQDEIPNMLLEEEECENVRY